MLNCLVWKSHWYTGSNQFVSCQLQLEGAKYYLTPSSTTVSVERLFSTAGDISTNDRNRLKPENAGKLLFLLENLPKIQFRYDMKVKEQPLDNQDDTYN